MAKYAVLVVLVANVVMPRYTEWTHIMIGLGFVWLFLRQEADS